MIRILFLTLTSIFLAKSEIDFLHSFPDLVLGNPLTGADSLKAAIGPISSLTMQINSLAIVTSFFCASTNLTIALTLYLYNMLSIRYFFSGRINKGVFLLS